MGRITASCIERIHDATVIEEAVGEFVQLKKSGCLIYLNNLTNNDVATDPSTS